MEYTSKLKLKKDFMSDTSKLSVKDCGKSIRSGKYDGADSEDSFTTINTDI